MAATLSTGNLYNAINLILKLQSSNFNEVCVLPICRLTVAKLQMPVKVTFDK